MYVHMLLRHSTGYKPANDGADTRSIQSYLRHRDIRKRLHIVLGCGNGVLPRRLPGPSDKHWRWRSPKLHGQDGHSADTMVWCHVRCLAKHLK
jgi:hypothetical protein